MKGQDPIAPALSLSAFLRALRERQSPAEFGLAAGPRRRTPGLRREEVAQLCGLSVTWYTWIEQGRDVSVSASALARLARGLRLSRAERSYLFEVAGKRDPERPGNRDDPPEGVLACVDAIDGPAYILDRTGAPAVGTRRRPDCLLDGSMLTANKTSCATSSSGPRLELSSLTGRPVRIASSQSSAPR
jgi:transcriptional regulator with XRE-family HTH domain